MADRFDSYDTHGYSSYHAGAPATGSACKFYRDCFNLDCFSSSSNTVSDCNCKM